jgi:hypothetical protein
MTAMASALGSLRSVAASDASLVIEAVPEVCTLGPPLLSGPGAMPCRMDERDLDGTHARCELSVGPLFGDGDGAASSGGQIELLLPLYLPHRPAATSAASDEPAIAARVHLSYAIAATSLSAGGERETVRSELLLSRPAAHPNARPIIYSSLPRHLADPKAQRAGGASLTMAVEDAMAYARGGRFDLARRALEAPRTRPASVAASQRPVNVTSSPRCDAGGLGGTSGGGGGGGGGGDHGYGYGHGYGGGGGGGGAGGGGGGGGAGGYGATSTRRSTRWIAGASLIKRVAGRSLAVRRSAQLVQRGTALESPSSSPRQQSPRRLPRPPDTTWTPTETPSTPTPADTPVAATSILMSSACGMLPPFFSGSRRASAGPSSAWQSPRGEAGGSGSTST